MANIDLHKFIVERYFSKRVKVKIYRYCCFFVLNLQKFSYCNGFLIYQGTKTLNLHKNIIIN